MQNKTLKELRELAKARGIRGYSKLSKAELVARLGAPAAAQPAADAHATSARGARPERRRRTRAPQPTAAETAASAPPSIKPPPVPAAPDSAVVAPTAAVYASVEERVEGAKYALRPNGATAQPPAADLNEDIDRLPALVDPMVCLLPQKPGVLYAYWVLPPGERASGTDYRLRLCRSGREALEVCEEIPVSADRGGWYFHVEDTPAESGMLVQLGYYRDGRFHSARGRSIARLPSLYAATRTDARWWIPEAEFMQMYLRAGGFVTPARRFAWAASIGSSGAAAAGPAEQRLAWPGGVSSK